MVRRNNQTNNLIMWMVIAGDFILLNIIIIIENQIRAKVWGWEDVLKGDMSVIGPRPHMLAHTEQYSHLIKEYMVRHFVKPGITGWAQVTGYRGETKELWQMEERVRRDIWYIEHWTIWLDFLIVWLTFKSFFVHDENAY
jgi:lipopolysaccharide/colanic/teichoic acid biosynthesis glycosyltransferase